MVVKLAVMNTPDGLVFRHFFVDGIFASRTVRMMVNVTVLVEHKTVTEVV